MEVDYSGAVKNLLNCEWALMTNLRLALDLEGVLITNAISQFPRPGLMSFLNECEDLFGHENIFIFTTVNEKGSET